MRLMIGQHFDGGAWPALIGEAMAGGAIEGPRKLLERIEVALGVACVDWSAAERLARLVPAFEEVHGYYSASATTDPFATAKRLLRERDELVMAGWRQQPVSQRLKELAALERFIEPGEPDRLLAILATLQRRGSGLEAVGLVEEERTWPLLWRKVFDALRATGTTVSHLQPEQASPQGDLLKARQTSFAPEGDDSLLLLRGAGPVETADELAAYLASLELGTTVIVQPDATLDAALARHGLPTTGASERPGDSTAMQVLPLVLELLWDPPDPASVHELLSLPQSPVPGRLQGKLRRALETWPAVRSPAWNEAYAEWLENPGSEKFDATKLTERVERLLTPAVEAQQDEVPVAAVLERLAALNRWMNARGAPPEKDKANKTKPTKETPDNESWADAIAQVSKLRSLLELAKVSTVGRVRLRKLVELASEGVRAKGRHDAQAGFAQVSGPGAVAGPADTIVWWNFDRDHSPPMRALPLTRAEKEALAAEGVELPSAGQRAVDEGRTWRLPLLSARHRLILCCPRSSESGEALAPHALWDEIEAVIPDDQRQRASLLKKLVKKSAPVARTSRELRATPKPRYDWNVGGSLKPRETESPSSLETLVGCSFKWAARHGAALSEHHTQTLELGNRVIGILAHHVLEHVLVDLPPTAVEAREKAVRLYNEDGPRLVAQLFQPGMELKRADVARIIGSAAERLTDFIIGSGRTVAAVEDTRSRRVGKWTLEGQMDLRLEGPDAVIDLKFGSGGYRKQSLEDGTATQLASYAFLISGKANELPPVGYFILSTQALYSTEAALLGAGAQQVDGPSPEDTWKAFRKTVDHRWRRLDQGLLTAPGVDEQQAKEDENQQVDGGLSMDPPCHFCQYAALCGRRFGEAR